MTTFRVEFDTDNAAFEDGELWKEGTFEIERIMKKIAGQVRKYGTECRGGRSSIRDMNGNTIGYWEWEEDE